MVKSDGTVPMVGFFGKIPGTCMLGGFSFGSGGVGKKVGRRGYSIIGARLIMTGTDAKGEKEKG